MKTNFQTVEDLLVDESFLAWHHQTDENAVQAWNQWIIANARNRHMVKEAIRLLKQLQVTEKRLPTEQINAATDRLLQAIKKP